MGTHKVTENDFNVLHFEKQLTTLKDSQEAINSCCQWCLQNRTHHKKIVNSWLNVLKRVKVEQRLILFYLANDVVQYSKRRNYEYVESWGTALQKATTMVRDEKVKHKILRIFKIWEQRNVYNEEFISDLCGLLSVQPSGTKSDEPHEFQPNYVINKIKSCVKLEMDTDIKLKHLKEHNPKIQIDDGLIGSLKDRAHMDDVEKEVEVYVKHMEDYINALKLEIKNRITLISVLKQAETQLEADRKDVKVVANAYKMFGTRVKTFQRKLEEHKSTLSSPIPSPDINAPSPSSDSDIDLPDDVPVPSLLPPKELTSTTSYNPKAELQQQQQQYNAGYYNSVQTEENMSNSFLSNGFPSFIGSDLSFNLDNLNGSIFNVTADTSNTTNDIPKTTYSPSIQLENPPLPVQAPTMVSPVHTNYSYTSVTHQLPLMPPPMPLFSKSEQDYSSGFGQSCVSTTESSPHFDNDFFNTTASAPFSGTSVSSGGAPFLEDSYEPPDGANPYPPSSAKTTSGGSDEYNPEDDVLSWEVDNIDWDGGGAGLPRGDTDTPESPPTFEKEGYVDPVEYHESNVPLNGAASSADVDHRILPTNIVIDLEDSLSSLGGKDVDHRNLISLTGSPGNSNSDHGASESAWNNQNADQDYRLMLPNLSTTADQDYRMGFNIEQLKLPPPPPPPSKFPSYPVAISLSDMPSPEIAPVVSLISQPTSLTKSPRKSDNIDSIDMELSDEDILQMKPNENLKVIVDSANDEQRQFSLEPPPPLPDLPDDVDANNFLDDLSCDLHEFSNLSDELNSTTHVMDDARISETDVGILNQSVQTRPVLGPNTWNSPHPVPPMPFSNLIEPPPILPSMNTPPPSNMPPPPMMNAPPPAPMLLPPHPTNWLNKDDSVWNKNEEENQWFKDDHEENDASAWKSQEESNMMQQAWMGPPPPNNAVFGFRGRGINRGNLMRRGRGRNNFNRGGNIFRGTNISPRGGLPKNNRGQWSPRATFRGNFRGGF